MKNVVSSQYFFLILLVSFFFFFLGWFVCFKGNFRTKTKYFPSNIWPEVTCDFLWTIESIVRSQSLQAHCCSCTHLAHLSSFGTGQREWTGAFALAWRFPISLYSQAWLKDNARLTASKDCLALSLLLPLSQKNSYYPQKKASPRFTTALHLRIAQPFTRSPDMQAGTYRRANGFI